MGIDKIKMGLFGSNTIDNSNEDDEINYKKSDNAFKEVSGNNKMILFEPRAYSESQQIADYLKNNCAVVVKLQRVTPDQAKRIVDFLSGTLYAINGDLQKLGGGIFLCTPHTIDVEGKISDDAQSVKSPKKVERVKEEEIDW